MEAIRPCEATRKVVSPFEAATLASFGPESGATATSNLSQKGACAASRRPSSTSTKLESQAAHYTVRNLKMQHETFICGQKLLVNVNYIDMSRYSVESFHS